MIFNAYLWRRACLLASAAGLALLLAGCGGSDDSDDAPAEVPIVTNPSSPVVDPADACTCTAPNTQRSCAP